MHQLISAAKITRGQQFETTPVRAKVLREMMQCFGLAIDAAEKARFREHGAVISERYAPHDFCFNGVYHDIKSTQGRYLSISFNELDFAEAEVEAGRDVIYVIYSQDDAYAGRYSFIGCVSFKKIWHEMQMGSSPYWDLDFVKRNLL